MFTFMKTLILVLIFLVNKVKSSGFYDEEKNIFGHCKTAHYSGVCVPAIKCGNLFKLLNNFTNLKDSDRMKLKDAQCGYNNYLSLKSEQTKLLLCCEVIEILPVDHKIDNSQCGVAQKLVLSPRIVGGKKTSVTTFPWMALIEYFHKEDPKDTKYSCSGSLINNRYVLTAGHCVYKESNLKWIAHRVHLGDWDDVKDLNCRYSAGNTECSSQSINIEEIIIHPDYPRKHYHDIALVRLQSNIQYSAYIRPICLPTGKLEGLDLTFTNTEVANWGQEEIGGLRSHFTDQKFKIALKVWQTDKCLEKYNYMNRTVNPEYEMCAGGAKGVDTCVGDSGGPLMFWTIENRLKVYHVVGVLSYGPRPCGFYDFPSVNIKVDRHIKWIENSMQKTNSSRYEGNKSQFKKRMRKKFSGDNSKWYGYTKGVRSNIQTMKY